MKKHLFSLLLSVMLVACAEPYQDSSDSNFRMHLRLWPAHHNDTELQDQLIDALKEYPSLWDDAWLCMETNTISMDAHRVSAQNMGRMDLFRFPRSYRPYRDVLFFLQAYRFHLSKYYMPDRHLHILLPTACLSAFQEP